MSKVQLAILPENECRAMERRVVNLAAQLRPLGAWFMDATVWDISATGFRAECPDNSLVPGNFGWAKLCGLPPVSFKVIWINDGLAGFQFIDPLSAVVLEHVLFTNRRPSARGHFGPGSH